MQKLLFDIENTPPEEKSSSSSLPQKQRSNKTRVPRSPKRSINKDPCREIEISELGEKLMLIAEAILSPDGDPSLPWKFRYYSEVPEDMLKDPTGKLYVFVATEADRVKAMGGSIDARNTRVGKVKKIGGSADAKGILGTLRFYEEGRKGTPSISRYGINWLITECLKKGDKVYVYLMLGHTYRGPIRSFFREDEGEILAYKTMEKRGIGEYKTLSGGYEPEWNMQESGTRWSNEIRAKHAALTGKPTQNRKPTQNSWEVESHKHLTDKESNEPTAEV